MTEMVKSQINDNKSGDKKVYIEVLRGLATIAVVFLHVVMTLVANYSVEEIGVYNYAIFNDCYMLVKWAVPCFIMITGALLLNPKKELNEKKIKKYIVRMIMVLATFGVAYALMELIFNAKTFSVRFILKAIINTLEGKSWSHMWYIYLLIGLYLLTLPLRKIIANCTTREMKRIIIMLIVGNFLIPSINSVMGTEFETYMLVSEYITYYLVGYYITADNFRFSTLKVLFVLVSSVGFLVISETISLLVAHKQFPLNHQTQNIFTFIMAISVFIFVKQICESKNVVLKSGVRAICKYSFAIYLVHPFFINVIYKVIGFTPLSIPIFLGIIILDISVFALSFIAAVILKKIPVIKTIV